MPKLYSIDLKEKVINALESGYTATSISQTFDISRKTIFNWQKKLKETGTMEPEKFGRKDLSGKIQDLEEFRKFVEEKPDRSSTELAKDWGDISSSTIRKYLKRIGFTNKKNFWVSKPLRQ